MYKIIDYQEIDTNKVDINHILIDLRSPDEYISQKIPGSINIPLFDNEERILIGTIYKQESAEKAKRLGIEIVAKKLSNIYDLVHELNKRYNNLIFFCARGGLRSSSIVSLFEELGINAIKLNNGYKGYRKYINEQLPAVVEEIQFIVLYGNTGTGKTDILKALKRENMNILDLEGCANHRGSVLGSVGLGDQNTQKTFESLIYDSLRNRNSNLVFIEGESKYIGRNVIPDYLFNAMKRGYKIGIEASMKRRVEIILKDYVHKTDSELISALNYLRRNLGNTNIDSYIKSIDEQKYEEVIEDLMIKYYDPLYLHEGRIYDAVFSNEKTPQVANDIIKWLRSYSTTLTISKI